MWRRWTEGYRLTLLLILATAIIVPPAAFGPAYGELAYRRATRLTVEMGGAVFLAAFVASSANALFRAGWSKWLLRNRRYLGLAFAGIHLLHAAAFLSLAALYPESFWRTTSRTSIIGGSVGYAWVIAMAITSFDSTANAIGKRNWKILHKSGMYVLWGIFLFSYVGRVHRSAGYAAVVFAFVLAFFARVIAAAKQRAPTNRRTTLGTRLARRLRRGGSF